MAKVYRDSVGQAPNNLGWGHVRSANLLSEKRCWLGHGRFLLTLEPSRLKSRGLALRVFCVETVPSRKSACANVQVGCIRRFGLDAWTRGHDIHNCSGSLIELRSALWEAGQSNRDNAKSDGLLPQRATLILQMLTRSEEAALSLAWKRCLFPAYWQVVHFAP